MRDCLVRFLLGWISRGSGDRQGFSLDNDMLHAYTEGETNETIHASASQAQKAFW